jgi:formylglycine-generating enzyme required for sulfatase activity
MVSVVEREVERERIKPPYEPIDPPLIEHERSFKNEILILISAPLLDGNEQPVVALSVQREVDEICDAVADLDLDLKIVVKIATVEVLNEVFSDRRSPIVIHFIGHGMTSEQGVALVLEDDVGMARSFAAQDFRRLLGDLDRAPCQVAFLNACHSRGLAAELLDAGVDHVVVINAADTILDAASRCFARAFYAALLRGNTVQQSFGRGRTAVELSDSLRKEIDWATLKPANLAESLKFHLLPGNSRIHQNGLAMPNSRAGGVNIAGWEKTNLSSEDRSFIGRNLEIHQIAVSLERDKYSCIALAGMGGIGKTSLAKAVGRWQHERGRWRDGVWFVDLRNVETVAAVRSKVMQVVEEVIDQVQRRDSYSNQDLQALLRRTKMLLILDDLDAVLTKATEIQDLVDCINALLSNRGICLLITARQLLPNDIDYKLQEIQCTTLDISRQIFRKYAPMEIVNQDDLTAVLELLDGYPLAIRIAATYMNRRCSLRELKEELIAEFRKVFGGSPQYPNDKSRSLIVSLNLSYAILPPATQEMFANLALFPGGLTIEATRYIFGQDAKDALATLLLFSMAEKPNPATWWLPEPARQYAIDRQSLHPDVIVTHKSKTLKYFHDLLEGLENYFLLEMINQHQINLKHFLDWAYEHELADRGVCHSARITVLVAKYWQALAPGEDPLVGIDRALVAADRCRDQLAVADLHKVKGDRQLIQQGLSVAQKSYAKVIDLYGAIRQNSFSILEQAQIQQKLGTVWESYLNPGQAEIFYLKAIELYESAGEPLQAAAMKMVIGDVQRDAEKLAVALISYQEALKIYQSLSNRSGIVKAESRIRRLLGLTEELKTSEPFEVMTINQAGVITNCQQHCVKFFREILPDGIELEMIAVPQGKFLMGSPNGEDYSDFEKPQHFVNVPEFFMGKYLLTQEQWRSIALLTELQVTKLNPEPSHFSGQDRPVESISWYAAIEFCDRLSKITNKKYRLPTEAEWEYACRAGTTTPFCYGETITTNLANYNGDIYANEQQGLYRGETTSVNQFPSNAFGLYDLHGNVGEWCVDNWHGDYQNAPSDGSAWIDTGNSKNYQHVVRGGSWFNNPFSCRSASRCGIIYYKYHQNVGFRVVYIPDKIV